MDDKIVKLLKQAEHYVDTFVVEESWCEADRQYAVNEKFAELIIKECVDCLESLGQTSRVEARDTIQEHFGLY